MRHGDASALAPVFAHNRQDVLSLVTLTARLGRIVADPLAACSDPADLLAAGRLQDELGWSDTAEAGYAAGSGSGRRPPTCAVRPACGWRSSTSGSEGATRR